MVVCALLLTANIPGRRNGERSNLTDSVRPLTYPPRALGKAAVNTTALAVHVLAAAAACCTRSAAHGTIAQGQCHCDCMQAGPCTIWRLRTGMTNAGIRNSFDNILLKLTLRMEWQDITILTSR